MAYTNRVHGDYQPVMNYDAPDYTVGAVNAVTSEATVQPQGPKLDFFTVTANGAISTTQLNTGIQTIQQLATVYLYEYTNDTNDTLAVAVYPVGAWTDTALATALEANPGPAWANGVAVTTSATFTG